MKRTKRIDRYFKAREIWNNPQDYIEISDVGKLHLQWLTDRFAYLFLKERLPLFDKAYNLMVERGNFSRKNAFGEIHGDNYMWVEKCEHSKVIVLETQSNMYLFVRDKYNFHIRELLCKYLYPSYRKAELKLSKLKAYKDINFENSYDNNGVFQFADARDIGYLGSVNFLIEDHARLNTANQHILFVIGLMDFWEIYIDNPEELE